MRQSALLQLVQGICQHSRRFDQLLRFAVVSERIPLKGKERELVELVMAFQILEEPPEPSGFAEFNSSGNLRLLDVLEAWPTKSQSGIDIVERFCKLQIQSREMLRGRSEERRVGKECRSR